LPVVSTKGLFYHYFDSKEELMKAVLHSVYVHFKTKLFSLAYSDVLAPEEKLAKFLDKAERLFLHSEGGCLMANIALETLTTQPEFVPFIRQFFMEWTDAMAHIYEAVYQPEAARSVAEQTVQEFEGAVLFMRVFGDKRYLSDALERAVKRLAVV
jgi:AcrR family transcriptional regulator